MYIEVFDKIIYKINKNIRLYKLSKTKLANLCRYDRCPACRNMELNQEAHDLGFGYCMADETINKQAKYEADMYMFSKKAKRYIGLRKVLIKDKRFAKFQKTKKKTGNKTSVRKGRVKK